jgi:FAD/FMN-containing dehydrogenase
MPGLRALTRGGEPMELGPLQVDGLRGALRGPLLAEGDPGFDQARSIWNAMIERRPALVARCLGVADVLACVRFARESGIALSIKGGGHNISGLAVADGGLMIDLSLQRGVWVDAADRVAHAQTGCLLGDVDRETQLHGLAAVLGFVSQTGIAGLTLGGGFGYLSRRFGWTSDNVRSMQLVTADGRIVQASERENEDLFWALRGGGGNFGVVTGIEYALHPVGPEIVGGAIAWRAEDAPGVLELYQELVAGAPPELALTLVLRLGPPVPWLDPSAHGKLIVAVFVCYTGSLADGERWAARLKAHGRPVGDVVQRRPYTSQQSIVDAANPAGRRYYWKAEYLPGIERPLLACALEHATRIRSPHSAVIVFPLGDAIGRRPNDHSAVGNRDAQAVFNVTAAWERAVDDEANVSWAREAWRDLRRFSTGGTYVNFLSEEERGDRIRDAYGANLARLVEVKSRWDPDNVFRANKNIEPAR